MIEQKKNDWLATMFLSPDKSVEDLITLGINPDNSVIQEEDYYKKIPQIQERFKKEDGSFDDGLFSKYYNEVLDLYNKADEENVKANVLDFYTYDPIDYLAPKDGKIRDIAPKLVEFANPERRARGLTNLHEISAPTMSAREIAQTNQVFNTETGKFEDWTPNDWGGLKAVTRPSLVLAQWDADGTHEMNGRTVQHKAGDLKFNNYGDPYYETLGGRSLAGKELLHVSDTLTVDGSNWNKYDFLDSDGLDKSVVGTVAKTALKIAPMFIPGVGGAIYGGVTAALEIGKLLPVLYKSIEGIATGDLTNSKTAEFANDMQAWFSKFDSSVSDKGKQGFFNLENLGNIISDSSKQLFQQRMIGKIPMLFAKGKTPTEEMIKWGQGLSMAYMAGTSTMESYDAFKAAGASDRAAGLGMLATAVSMHKLMNNDYFKDFWFKDSYLDRSQVRQAIQSVASKSRDSFAKESAETSAKWVLKMSDKIADAFSKIKPDTLLYGAINEGIEETVEEINMDLVKGFFNGLNYLGIIDSDKEYDFGFSVEDIASRYMMSAIGGAIGGVVFNLQGRYENWINGGSNADKIDADTDGFKQLIYLHRQGKGDSINRELERLYKKGKLASTNLSAEGAKIVMQNGSPKLVYGSAEKGKSQNDAVYNQIKNYIDWINDTMEDEGLKLSDKQLEDIILKWKEEDPDLEISKEQARDIISMNAFNERMKMLIDKGVSNRIYEDWNNLTADILKTKADMEKMASPKEGESSDSSSTEDKIKALKKNAKYKEFEDKLKELRKQRDELISGKKNDFYYGQWRFALSPNLALNFVKTFGLHNYVKENYNVNWEDITDETTKANYQAEYEKYSKFDEKAEIFRAYDMFSKIQEKVNDSLINVGKTINDSSEIFDTDNTLYTASMIGLAITEAQLKAQRNELVSKLPEGVDTSPEIQDVDTKLANIENQRVALESNPLMRIGSQLNKKGANLMHRVDSSATPDQLQDYYKQYLGFLTTLANKGLYMGSDDLDYKNMVNVWARNNLAGGVNSKLSDSINAALLQLSPDIEPDFAEAVGIAISDSITQSLGNAAESFIKGNIDEAIASINSILENEELLNQIGSFIEDYSDNPAEFLSNVINNFFGDFGGMNFVDYASAIRDTKAQIKHSPIVDVLTSLEDALGRNGQEILTMLDKELQEFLNLRNVGEYLIQNPGELNRLKELLSIIDIARALIGAADADGYNGALNKYRTAVKKQELAIFDAETKRRLGNELNTFALKIQSLIEVAEANGAKNMIREQSIEKNMRSKFLELWRGENALVKTFSEIFDIDIDDLLKSVGLEGDLPEDQSELLKRMTDFETALYKTIKSKGLSNEEIANNLFAVFDGQLEDIMTQRPTKFTDDSKVKLSAFDKLVYMASVIAAPSQNFEKRLKDICNDPELKIAPIYSQTYAAKIAWTRVLRPELFNNILKKMQTLAQKNSDSYIKTKGILENYIGVYGGAGTGKTRGVAKLVSLILGEDYEIIGSGPSDEQTTNLQATFGESLPVFVKDELLKNIIGHPLNRNNHDPIMENGGVMSYRFKGELKGKFNPYNGKKKLLILDEVRQYTRVELEAISKWAKMYGVTVLGLGDYIQDSAKIEITETNASNKGSVLDSSTEDFWEIKTPELTAPLRPNNIAAHDNEITLSSALHTIMESFWSNPSISPKKLDDIATDLLSRGKLRLKYFNKDGKFAGGTKMISANDIETYVKDLEKLVPDGETVAIITDDLKKYDHLKSSKVEVVHSSKVQGREFAYVVIDRDVTHKKMGVYNYLKNVYTLTQRGRSGTLIATSINDHIETYEDSYSSGDIQLKPEQVEAFINWKKEVMSKISDDEIDTGENDDSEGESSTGEPSPSPSTPPTNPTPPDTPTQTPTTQTTPPQVPPTIPPAGGETTSNTESTEEELPPFDPNISIPEPTIIRGIDKDINDHVEAIMDSYKSGDFGVAASLISETMELAKIGRLDATDRRFLADISEACRIAGWNEQKQTEVGKPYTEDLNYVVVEEILDTNLPKGARQVRKINRHPVYSSVDNIPGEVVIAYNPTDTQDPPTIPDVEGTYLVWSDAKSTAELLHKDDYPSELVEETGLVSMFTQQGAPKDAVKTTWNHLRSYFLYGHWKSGEGKRRLINVMPLPTRQKINILTSLDHKIISRMFNGKVWICAEVEFTDGKTYNVPLFIASGDVTVGQEFDKDIDVVGNDKSYINTAHKKTTKVDKKSAKNGYNSFGPYVVFPKTENGVITGWSSDHWVSKHNGTQYQLITTDTLLTQDDVEKMLRTTTNEEEVLAVDYSNPAIFLAGSKTAVSLSEFALREKGFTSQDCARFLGLCFELIHNPEFKQKDLLKKILKPHLYKTCTYLMKNESNLLFSLFEKTTGLDNLKDPTAICKIVADANGQLTISVNGEESVILTEDTLFDILDSLSTGAHYSISISSEREIGLFKHFGNILGGRTFQDGKAIDLAKKLDDNQLLGSIEEFVKSKYSHFDQGWFMSEQASSDYVQENSVWKKTIERSKGIHVWNIQTVVGPKFKVTAHVSGNPIPNKVAKANEFFAQHGLNRGISNIENLPSVVDSINQSFIAEQTDWEVSRISLNSEGELSMEKVSSPETMMRKLLTKLDPAYENASIELVKNARNMFGFLVSLGSETKYMIANKDSVSIAAELSEDSFNLWNQLMDVFESQIIPGNSVMFIADLLNMKNQSNHVADYLEYKTSGDPNIINIVDNFLMSKLMNDEC